MERGERFKEAPKGSSVILRPEDFVNQTMYQEILDILKVPFGKDVKDELNILISHYKAYPQD